MDEVVVVTGAGRGIGRALAARFAGAGARVVVNDVDATAVERVAAEIGGYAVPGNAATERGVADLVAAARERFGEVDTWCANAGIDVGRTLTASEEEWAAGLEVNLLAHVRAARLLVPGWAERGSGRFVVTASAAGLLTMLGAPVYSVTKHGALAFAEWLSATYRHRGVHVHAICPQGVNTRMLHESGPVKELLTHDRQLEPEDVADALWQAVEEDRFLVLPHPEVAGYYTARATDPDRWLTGMNRIQQHLDRQEESG